MTREDYLSLIARIESGNRAFERDCSTLPLTLLEDCKNALRELYVENLGLELRVCGLRAPGLIMTGTTESKKDLEKTTLRASAIREELKSLRA